MTSSQFIAGAVTAFIFGITIGSFLNVCIYRLPLGESLSTPPSHCPKCNTRLRTPDLFPLFSFLLLRGRCRYCGVRISWRYFSIELITGFLFVACWWSLAARFSGEILLGPLGVGLMAALGIFVAAMLVTFMIDLDTTYVIEPVTWVGMAAGLAFELLGTRDFHGFGTHLGALTIPYLPMAVPGMIIGFLVFIGMDLFGRLLFRKPGMGLGDAYIGAAIGAMLGPGLALLSFGIAIMLGALVGIVLMIAGALTPSSAPGTETPDTEGALREDEELPQGRYMPFGPFLTASAVAVMLAPTWFLATIQQLWQSYMRMFA